MIATKKSKPAKLGCVNATSPAKIFNDDMEVVGYCNDTPNAAAYAFNKVREAFMIKSWTERYFRIGMEPNRIDNAGWFTSDKQAGFKRI
jgi:hypothetical protein